ncbi:MAG: 16S rRNA (guanine(527)-N(7))-methyltransferase RsmG [Oscillospiraceae bacterium]|nr:16S rRNA (guanine(527)-N(7))-methyltransferase RsmG [Oscillospiraceae bacterium]
MEEILVNGAKAMGLPLDPAVVPAFRAYYTLLEEKSRVMNLTAIHGEQDVARLHFLDCLALMTLYDFTGKTVIDIGSGAGFPGFPIAIAGKSVKLTCLDAQQKRIDFLRQVADAIGRSDIICLHARAEDAALTGLGGSFDIAVSRAVARLNILCELCIPFVKVGGVFIAMKSVDTEEEINEAKHAIKILGGKIERVEDYSIPGTEVTHRAVIIRKMAPTPKGYPRRFAKIQKAPL